MAVRASVKANCQPCLLVNDTRAQENGADDQEIAEAIEIGKMARSGAAAKMDKYVANLGNEVPQAVDPASQECGCHPN